MASIFDGMFDSPEDIKNKRMQDIMDAQTRLSQSGGSMSQLLGQVAGQGLLTGRKLGEIGGSMAGLSSRSENKAAELQAMMQSIDPNNPNDLANMAKMMNELGYIKEAIAILERRNQVVNQQSKEQEATTKKAQGDTRTVQKVVMRPMQIGSGKDAKVVQVPTQVSITQEWKNGAWVDIVPDTVSTAADGKYGGITVIDPKTGMTTLKQGDPAVDGFTEDLTISP